MQAITIWSMPRCPVEKSKQDVSPGESQKHLDLKRLAILWIQQQGYIACASEVRIPRSGFRADIAAYAPVRGTIIGQTAILECKQSRADFLTDSYSSSSTLEQLKKLDERRFHLERLLRIHYPSLRNGDSLFQEYETCDFTKIEHRAYASVMKRIGVLKSRLYGKTKFDKLLRWQCANLHYLVTEEGILADHELPTGWGLLVRENEQLLVRRKPVWQNAPDASRQVLLYRIAVAGTRKLNREIGIAYEEARGVNHERR